MQPVMILIGAAATMFAVIDGLSMLEHYFTLSGIKSSGNSLCFELTVLCGVIFRF